MSYTPREDFPFRHLSSEENKTLLFANLETLTRLFIRWISVASNAIQTTDDTAYLIIDCLNCIRRDGNSACRTGLRRQRDDDGYEYNAIHNN